MFKKIKNLIVFFIVIMFIFIAVNSVFADDPENLNNLNVWGGGNDEVSEGSLQVATGLGAEDPRIIVAKIIRIALGFLGIISIILIMYAGWLYMSSNGNQENIDKAKKILVSALIGLLIILSAFLIASFILSKLMGATGAKDTNNVVTPGGIPGDGSDTSSFYIKNILPQNGSADVIRNIKIRFYFNSFVNNETVNDVTFAVKDGQGNNIEGERVVTGRKIEFIPNSSCPENSCASEEKCFEANKEITVTAKSDTSGILNVNGLELACGITTPCSITFTVGEIIDCEVPVVSLDFNQVCVSNNNEIYAISSDDVGVAQVEFFVDNVSIDNTDNPVVNNDFSKLFNTSIIWDGASHDVGEKVIFKATVFDLDNHEISDSKSAILYPEHCCNGELDANIDTPEEGIDCGGECANCSGVACGISLNVACGDDYENCDDNRCVGFCNCGEYPNEVDLKSCTDKGYNIAGNECCVCEERPIIYSFSPEDGKEGTMVTIIGRGFSEYDSENSMIYFNNVEAELASSINSNCTDSWSSTQIIAVVPVGANDGEIKVKNVRGYEGISSEDFDVNDKEYPGLCGVSNITDIEKGAKGEFMEKVELQGIFLNIANGNYENIVFGSTESYNDGGINFSNDGMSISGAVIPNIAKDKISVFIEYEKDGNITKSNPLGFYITPYSSQPVIMYFSPKVGHSGDYVTIFGSNFGNIKGQVFFGNKEASYDFPPACSNSFWKDDQIIVKIPYDINNGNYKIKIITSQNLETESDLSFRVGDYCVNNENKDCDINDCLEEEGDCVTTNRPSICLIKPDNGPVGLDVKFYGEHFGNQGSVKFYNDKNANITYWDISGDSEEMGGDKDSKDDRVIISDVPDGAQSGETIILNNNGVASNKMNFFVNNCNDEDKNFCHDNNTAQPICCPPNYNKGGSCVDNISACGGEVTTVSCQYYWSFGTYNTIKDFLPCDGNLDNPGCQASDDVCKKEGENWYCYIGEDLESDDYCTCKEGNLLNSCSGYDVEQCNYNYCPNSYGKCSSKEKEFEIDGNCCDSGYGYNKNLKKCVKNNFNNCNLPKEETITILNQDYKITKYCAFYEDNNYWHYNGNCGLLDGWENIGNNVCVKDIESNKCNLCGDNLECLEHDGFGFCSIDDNCSIGYECNNDSECQKVSDACCECCCDINKNTSEGNPECCVPLQCGIDCGAGGIDVLKLDDDSDDNPYNEVGDVDFGKCSGCVVLDANGNIDQLASDKACVCENVVGKFCDTIVDVNGDEVIDASDGVCRDCSELLKNTMECSVHHNTCCVDAMKDKVCRGGKGYENIVDSDSLAYCAYYRCDNDLANGCYGDSPDYTKIISFIDSVYTSTDACVAECVFVEDSNLGEECIQIVENEKVCSYDICPDYYCLDENGGELALSGGIYSCPLGNCGFCCCDPKKISDDDSDNANYDKCNDINIDLMCQADKGSCSGEYRGKCCGCDADNQCGNIELTGCGYDTCCSGRPNIIDELGNCNENDPKPCTNATDICRNAEISVVFDKKMEINSFSGNVIVVGNYEDEICPEGTQYLTFNNKSQKPKNIFAKTYFNILKFINKISKPIIGKTVFADANNYCAIQGTINNENKTVNGKEVTKLIFSVDGLMDAEIEYYVIIKGDKNLDSKNGVLSYLDVGMNGYGYRDENDNLTEGESMNFNGKFFKNSYIWKFKTLSESQDVTNCQINSVKVEPDGYIFQTTYNDFNENDSDPSHLSFDSVKDSDKVFIASALSVNGQSIVPVEDRWWDWVWWVDDESIVNILSESGPFTLADRKKLIIAQEEIVDGRTIVNAKARINEEYITGASEVFVFLCNNPWPPINTNGSWFPWEDNCLTCSDNIGDCNGKKNGESCGAGVGVCEHIGGACKNTNYELYYCRDSGKDNTFDDLPAILSNDIIIRGTADTGKCLNGFYEGKSCPLNNCEDLPIETEKENLKCIFGKCSTGVELIPSGGHCSSDKDCQVAGTCLFILKESYFFREKLPDILGIDLKIDSVFDGGEKVNLSWGDAIIEEGEILKNYKIYYGNESEKYEVEVDVGSVNTYVVDNLLNNNKYYFAITATYESGAESKYSNEASAIPVDIQGPDSPLINSIGVKDGAVDIDWSDASEGDAKSFRIYYKAESGDCDSSVDFGSSIAVPYSETAITTISNLNNGTEYCFGIVGYDQYGNTSVTTTVSAVLRVLPTNL